jgi:cob(I)alamin adenosyltransferase
VKLYTKTGDEGRTSLFGGARVPKNEPRVDAYGHVDELNAQLGVAIQLVPTESAWSMLRARLSQLQRELFTLGADLATPLDAPHRQKLSPIEAGHVARLESWIDEACAPLPELRGFVLPGGHPAAAALHVARTITRRAERAVAAAMSSAAVNPHALVYLNRLSDLLFAWARLANQLAGIEDVLWRAE